MKILKKGFNAVLQWAYTRNNPYYFFGVPKTDYVVKGGYIFLKRLNLQLAQEGTHSIIRGYPFALKIAEQLGGKFCWAGKDMVLELDNLVFRINSAEELFIIYEVFVTRVYAYGCTRDSVLVDIGMNSAVTTLFYARQDMIKRIFAFELFKPTFDLGKHNLELNPEYGAKVETNCYGLSDRNVDTVLDYSLSRKGRMGLRGLPADEQFGDVTKEHVMVRDVRPVFERIVQESEGMDIIVKIDCEGEEYCIVERLASTGLLKKLNVLMIEWHDSKSAVLERQLKDMGFHVFSQTLPNYDSGMIYAANRHANKN